jgi:hypothetical protein
MSTLRRSVYERDRGVCAACGRDAERAQRRGSSFERWRYRWSPYVRRSHAGWSPEFHRWRIDQWEDRKRRAEPLLEARRARMRAEGWPVDRRASWWEMDHIVEVASGGGQCGLDNLQTLCVPCHREKTARFARERAMKRETHQQPELFAS